jgi:hypothetical protein
MFNDLIITPDVKNMHFSSDGILEFDYNFCLDQLQGDKLLLHRLLNDLHKEGK